MLLLILTVVLVLESLFLLQARHSLSREPLSRQEQTSAARHADS